MTQKPRYNDIISQKLNDTIITTGSNLQKNSEENLSLFNVETSNLLNQNLPFTSISSTNQNLSNAIFSAPNLLECAINSNNDKVKQTPSNLTKKNDFSNSSCILQPTINLNNFLPNLEKNTTIYSSLLPPPSDLLLSGIWDKNLKFKEIPEQILPLQQHQNNYQPIFSVGGSKFLKLTLFFCYLDNTNNFFKNFQHPLLTYGANGIPILEPIRNNILIKNQQQQINLNNELKTTTKKQQIACINLCDLDIEQLIAKVQSLVDFAKSVYF